MKTNTQANSRGLKLKGTVVAIIYVIIVTAFLASCTGSNQEISEGKHFSGSTRLILAFAQP